MADDVLEKQGICVDELGEELASYFNSRRFDMSVWNRQFGHYGQGILNNFNKGIYMGERFKACVDMGGKSYFENGLIKSFNQLRSTNTFALQNKGLWTRVGDKIVKKMASGGLLECVEFKLTDTTNDLVEACRGKGRKHNYEAVGEIDSVSKVTSAIHAIRLSETILNMAINETLEKKAEEISREYVNRHLEGEF